MSGVLTTAFDPMCVLAFLIRNRGRTAFRHAFAYIYESSIEATTCGRIGPLTIACSRSKAMRPGWRIDQKKLSAIACMNGEAGPAHLVRHVCIRAT